MSARRRLGCYNFADRTDDRTEKWARFQRGCDLGYGKSCAALADALTIFRREPARAVALYQRACDLDVGEACFTLASQVESTDAARASTLHVRACDLEWMEACFLLANRRIATDRVAATRLYAKACGTAPPGKVDLDKMPSGAACVALAALVAPVEARGYLARGCQFGAEDGCIQLVRRLQTGSDGLPVDPTRAVEILRYTCDRRTSYIGTPILIGRACDEAGMFVRAKDPAAALALFQAACEPIYKASGWTFGDDFVADGEGCHHLARAYTRGEGTAPDATLASTARATACRLKFQPACDYIRCSITLGCTPVD